MVQIEADISGNPIIKWDDGAIASISLTDRDVVFNFQYKPLAVEKTYTLIKTEGKKYVCGKIVRTQGMVLR